MDYSKVCRSCMKKVEEPDNQESTLLDMFSYCTRLKINDDCKLPKIFCKYCTKAIKCSYSFIRKAHWIDDKLKALIPDTVTIIIKDSKEEKYKKEDYNDEIDKYDGNTKVKVESFDIKCEKNTKQKKKAKLVSIKKTKKAPGRKRFKEKKPVSKLEDSIDEDSHSEVDDFDDKDDLKDTDFKPMMNIKKVPTIKTKKALVRKSLREKKTVSKLKDFVIAKDSKRRNNVVDKDSIKEESNDSDTNDIHDTDFSTKKSEKVPVKKTFSEKNTVAKHEEVAVEDSYNDIDDFDDRDCKEDNLDDFNDNDLNDANVKSKIKDEEDFIIFIVGENTDKVNENTDKIDGNIDKEDENMVKEDENCDKIDENIEKVHENLNEEDGNIDKEDENFDKVDENFDEEDGNIDKAEKKISVSKSLQETGTGESKEKSKLELSCKICFEKFKIKLHLRRHIRTVHPQIKDVKENMVIKEIAVVKEDDKFAFFNSRGQKVYACHFCHKEFTTKMAYHNHIKNKEDGLDKRTCKICKKVLKTVCHVESHTKNVHQLKAKLVYECKECGNKFRVHQNLVLHQEAHKEVDPITCSRCNEQFRTIHDYKMHKSTHKQREPKAILCHFCGKKCSSKIFLKQHLNIHTDEKPYQCDLCPYKSAYRAGLRMHKVRHTGKKSYMCSYCPSTFVDHSTMKRHQWLHTGERPYHCPHCDQRFIDSWKRKTHIINKHHIPFEEIPNMDRFGNAKSHLDGHRVHIKSKKEMMEKPSL